MVIRGPPGSTLFPYTALFRSGPAPAGLAGPGDDGLEAPSADRDGAGPPADELRLPVMSALPRALVEVPIYLRDLSGTPLGVDRPAGQRLQGLSLSVVYSPAAAVESIAFAPAGLTEGLPALFETSVHSGHRISWIASFDEAASPLDFDLDRAEPGDPVAKLVLRVDASAIAGSVIDLTFDADLTAVSNQSGTLGETAANGLLSLGAGAIEVIDCSTAGDVSLPYQTIDFPLVCTAGGSITVGPGLRIIPPADVTLWAGSSVLFENELSVGARLKVGIDPSLRP